MWAFLELLIIAGKTETGRRLFTANFTDLKMGMIDIMVSCGVTIELVADDAKIYAEIIDIRDAEKLQRAHLICYI